jgi:regulator of protease activity HflC (stomatin/prohibitin superfamily)
MWIIAIIVIVFAVLQCVFIVPEAHEYIVETLGAYTGTYKTGIHFKWPIISRIARRVTTKEQVVDYPPQPVITKDNVTMQIDTVVYFRIVAAKKYAYGVDNPMMAMENLTATTLRNIIGELELDETLTSRETINSRMRADLDIATDPWGIDVLRVELRNIMPPRDIQDAMEKQMRAEREKRESILRAEGERQASILQAEGEKESAILRAEAKKIEMLREAEGHAESIRMHKEAEAEGIIKMQQAEATSIAMLKKAGLDNEDIVRLRSFDALRDAANGTATKIIIPSDIQNLTSAVVGVKEAAEQK